MTPTLEQQQIVEASLNGTMLKVNAIAGSGKTSTLRMIAEANSNKRCLYVAFNKAMQQEASRKMPSNTECRTMHSLAFREFSEFANKLTRPTGSYVNVAGTGTEISRYFKISPISHNGRTIVSSAAIGAFVKNTVSRFEQSGDQAIEYTHMAVGDIIQALTRAIPEASLSVTENVKLRIMDLVLGYAVKLWEARIDLNSPVIITHDTYLKLFQLSKPKLNYDIILLDEAQDANPCFLDIVKSNSDTCQVILVGDEFQAIYEWRGAVNAMKMIECQTLHLTKSFRYGDSVAALASAITGMTALRGNENMITEVCSHVTSRPGNYTYIFRTNAALLDEACTFLLGNKTSIAIQADVSDLCKLLESAIALYAGETNKVKHDLLIPYLHWDDLRTEVALGADTDNLGRLVKLVESQKAAWLLNLLKNYKKPYDPEIILTTAHKAKGLEYQHVVLSEDFPTPFKNGEFVGLPEAERNLLYVAVTRAIASIHVNQTASAYLRRSNSTKH